MPEAGIFLVWAMHYGWLKGKTDSLSRVGEPAVDTKRTTLLTAASASLLLLAALGHSAQWVLVPANADTPLLNIEAADDSNQSTLAAAKPRWKKGYRSTIQKLNVHLVEADTAENLSAPEGFRAVPVEPVQLLDLPNDPLVAEQWALNRIMMDSARTLEIEASGVLVAVVDTGIDDTHPELSGKVAAGVNLLEESGSYIDDHYHGTFCAYLIDARTKK